ncbi:aspartate kinase [Lutispora saccharofermentans]|uniref:Aspartokinase n=1 Tax=Lutispora saccharofermentans TaxID=3024236 RepID=A0ABT1NIF1_9FIRM|nr:aspartate kinase [Lutispora saccharofermentans]MCQ1531053.1 aspartate kinase [Lutispora saccharofermentans]
MPIIVQKYGGSSIESIEKIRNVAKRISECRKKGFDLVVVVSAMGKTTDYLIDMAHQVSSKPKKREMDVLMSTGEQVSISLLSIALNDIGIAAVSYTGPQLGIKTEGYHTKSRISEIDKEVILSEINRGKVVIVAGFQGVNEKNEITTLGRGGSDTTAVAIAAKLECPCEIYTDVDGVYTVDPRLYPSARKLESISYDEMLELASSGAGVLHTRSIELAEIYNVPLTVALNTGDIKGTIIKELDETMEKTAITGLAVDNSESMITLNGVPHDIKIIADIFAKIAELDINIDMISQTTPINKLVSISFTLPKIDLPQAINILEQYKEKIFTFSYDTFDNISKLTVIGIGMKSQSGVASKMFNILAENDISVHIITTSEIKISYVINPEDQQKAIEAVAREYNL